MPWSNYSQKLSTMMKTSFTPQITSTDPTHHSLLPSVFLTSQPHDHHSFIRARFPSLPTIYKPVLSSLNLDISHLNRVRAPLQIHFEVIIYIPTSHLKYNRYLPTQRLNTYTKILRSHSLDSPLQLLIPNKTNPQPHCPRTCHKPC